MRSRHLAFLIVLIVPISTDLLVSASLVFFWHSIDDLQSTTET